MPISTNAAAPNATKVFVLNPSSLSLAILTLCSDQRAKNKGAQQADERINEVRDSQ
jgi:hypothetical protein